MNNLLILLLVVSLGLIMHKSELESFWVDDYWWRRHPYWRRRYVSSWFRPDYRWTYRTYPSYTFW
jgi:hypothetical protein